MDNYISEIRIKNFQRYVDQTITFTPGVNVITGKTDTGKSSVIRAMRWIFENRPSGMKFKRRKTAPTTSVQCTAVVDGKPIHRTIGKSKNFYMFEGETFKGMGTAVPDPISSHTKITPINIQRQKDPAFLFGQTNSIVSKMINDVSGMTEIVSALDESNKRVRKSISNESFICEMIDEKEAEQNKMMKNIPAIVICKNIDKKILRLKKLKIRRNTAKYLIDKIKDLKSEIIPDIVVMDISTTLSFAVEKEKGVKNLELKISQLTDIIDKLRKYKKEKNLDVGKANSLYLKCQSMEEENSERLKSISNLRALIERSKNLDDGISDLNLALDNLVKNEKEIRKTIKFCPTCKREL